MYSPEKSGIRTPPQQARVHEEDEELQKRGDFESYWRNHGGAEEDGVLSGFLGNDAESDFLVKNTIVSLAVVGYVYAWIPFGMILTGSIINSLYLWIFPAIFLLLYLMATGVLVYNGRVLHGNERWLTLIDENGNLSFTDRLFSVTSIFLGSFSFLSVFLLWILWWAYHGGDERVEFKPTKVDSQLSAYGYYGCATISFVLLTFNFLAHGILMYGNSVGRKNRDISRVIAHDALHKPLEELLK